MTAQRATWRCLAPDCHRHGQGTTEIVDRQAAAHVRNFGHQVEIRTLGGVA